MTDISKAIENLTRSSGYAYSASKDGNLDAATRETILREAIDSNTSNLPDHMASHTARLQTALDNLMG